LLEPIVAQDIETNTDGKASLIKGVAKDRRISVEDAEMRHGRKSRSIRVVGLTPANAPEASVTTEINADLERQLVTLKELHIDRAYLSSHLVRERSNELEIYCKAWPVREGKRFSKQAFTLSLGSADHSLPSSTGDALCAWRRYSLPQRHLCPVPEDQRSAPPVPRGVVSAFILMKPCSSNYASANRPHKGVLNCVSGWRLSIRWLMSVNGKDGAPAIGDCAKTSLICVDALWSTIYMCWPVLSRFKLIFRALHEFLTGSLGRVKTYEAIVKGEDLMEPGVPAAFKVLVKEMQALGINVEILNEDAQEMLFVEDAADEMIPELGINLSGFEDRG
jgi:hypothetical protein